MHFPYINHQNKSILSFQQKSSYSSNSMNENYAKNDIYQ